MTNSHGSTKSTHVQVVRRSDLIEPELSYLIVGACFDVHNELGSGHLERVYQRALAKALQERTVPFREQVMVPVAFHGEQCAKHYLDFLIDQKVIVEIKRSKRFIRRDIFQLVGYLKALQLPLGLLVCFGDEDGLYRRVVNLD